MSENIKKASKRNNFTTVNNDYLQDENLSWKAKGIITYIMSLPENWILNVYDLRNRSKDGRDSTANGLKELIDNKYCIRIRSHSKGGLFAGFDYEVSDIKFYIEDTEQPYTEKPYTDKPFTEKPFTENPTLVNTNYSKDLLKINTDNIKENIKENIFGFEILESWNEQKIKNHRSAPTEKLVNDTLKKISLEDLKKSFKNYKEVLASDFFFNHIWDLNTFLKKQKGKPAENFLRFLPNGDIWENYKSEKLRKKPKNQGNKIIDNNNSDYF